MKITDCAFAAKKKQYIQPEVKVENLSFATSILLTGSGMSIHTESTEEQW